MKKLAFVLTLCLILLCSFCSAESSYTYGGSTPGYVDYLLDAAVAPDGRIVLTGHTDSHDGTLTTHTKTAPAGWALCIDPEGNVLWNFCSHYSNNDVMRFPVFREDGSVTMLMDTCGKSDYEVAWFHLDAQGNQLEYKLLAGKDAPEILASFGVQFGDEPGYLLSVFNKKTSDTKCLLYSFDGAFIREFPITQEAYSAGIEVFPQAKTADGQVVTIVNTEEPNYDAVVSLSFPE